MSNFVNKDLKIASVEYWLKKFAVAVLDLAYSIFCFY